MSDDLSGDMLAPSWPNLVFFWILQFFFKLDNSHCPLLLNITYFHVVMFVVFRHYKYFHFSLFQTWQHSCCLTHLDITCFPCFILPDPSMFLMYDTSRLYKLFTVSDLSLFLLFDTSRHCMLSTFHYSRPVDIPVVCQEA